MSQGERPSFRQIFKLGGGFDFILDQYNKVSVTAEISKLLVPTPPLLGTYTEFNVIMIMGFLMKGMSKLVNLMLR